MNRALPDDVKEVADAFASKVAGILGPKLYGIYLYGAAVFPDAGPVQDIDCHVVLNDPPSVEQKHALSQVRRALEEQYPPLGGELDAYFILLKAARGMAPPQHQLDTRITDRSWALHCAHVRAGRYATLWGPEPEGIFPDPSWTDLERALEEELEFVRRNLHYPAYCVLNLCRIVYSYSERDVVVSKRFGGRWAGMRFPRWEPLIDAAARCYEKKNSPEDDGLLEQQVRGFMAFCVQRIRALGGCASGPAAAGGQSDASEPTPGRAD